MFGESLRIDAELHEELRKRAIEFRSNPDAETIPQELVKSRLQCLVE